MTIDPTTLELALVAGVAAGVIAGLFGVGGGVVFVPTLVLLFGFGQLDAQATSLAAIIPVAVVGAWRQTSGHAVYWRGALLMGIGAAIGVVVGAEIATRIPDAQLARVFGVVLLVSGAEMIIRAGRRILSARADDPRRP
mgnify:FL=1